MNKRRLVKKDSQPSAITITDDGIIWLHAFNRFTIGAGIDTFSQPSEP